MSSKPSCAASCRAGFNFGRCQGFRRICIRRARQALVSQARIQVFVSLFIVYLFFIYEVFSLAI